MEEVEIVWISLKEIKRAAIDKQVREARALCVLGYLSEDAVDELVSRLEAKYFGRDSESGIRLGL